MHEGKKVKLVLENNEEFEGFSFGAEKSVSGEVVFSTGMVGYPESLTDPSYKGQILVLTYPLIGNYGVPGKEKEHELLKNFESDKIHVEGFVIRENNEFYSHRNSIRSIDKFLKEFRQGPETPGPGATCSPVPGGVR